MAKWNVTIIIGETILRGECDTGDADEEESDSIFAETVAAIVSESAEVWITEKEENVN
jgi:hypothetical protein